MAGKKLSRSTKARRIYEREAKGTKPGTGSRFKAMVDALEAKGAENPKALAAYIGRKKYGAEKFQEMAEKGRKKK